MFKSEASRYLGDTVLSRYISESDKIYDQDKSRRAEKSKEMSRNPSRQQSILLESLYKKYSNKLCIWLRTRYGSGPPDPEDVAQSAFEKISHVSGLEDMENPRAYLYTVAARKALDELKGIAVRRKYTHQVMVHYGDDVGEITPERVHSAKEDINAITKTMKKLTAVQREVVMRNRIMGQTYEEINAETGWSTSAISRYLKSAMLILAEAAKSSEKNGHEDSSMNSEEKTAKKTGCNNENI